MATRAKVDEQRTKISFMAAANDIRIAKVKLIEMFPREVKAFAKEILDDVKNTRPGRGVPLDKGPLSESGVVISEPVRQGRSASFQINFGGPGVPYALMQHENLEYHHDVGENRYLIRGIQRWSKTKSKAMSNMKRQVQAALTTLGRPRKF